MRRRVVVHGLVQGVYFRDTLRRRAERLGVRGEAANRDDGTVEAVFEGAPGAVEEMVRLSGAGPPAARVDRLEVSDEPPAGARGFRVR